MPSLPAGRFSGSLCSRDLILKLLHVNSSVPSKLPCEIIFWCTKLPISHFFDEFSTAEKCFLHMTVTALFPVSPPTVDGSHDFLLFLMLCQNFLGDLFHKASAMPSALHRFLVVYCCNLSGGVALIVWFTTNGMCVKNNTIIYAARASNNKRDCGHDLYCCLLPRCEALRTCRSGFRSQQYHFVVYHRDFLLCTTISIKKSMEIVVHNKKSVSTKVSKELEPFQQEFPI